MEETKEGGDTNSSQSEQEISEDNQSLIRDSLISSLTPSYLLMSSYNSYISRFEQITSSSGSNSSSSSSSSSSNETSESEDEDEERKENLSVSISE
ncbi:unnamed protein product [Paramecium octaurelia]|uniref:Uncharacterized protein n=1 Tax=Paramecium octaurelia TaxID=43137 RepID=A0A8S1VQS1_PAROT|nr:unnamed protein product [Paramecium octaurelia]